MDSEVTDNRTSNFKKTEWLKGRGTIAPLYWTSLGLSGGEWNVGMQVLNVVSAKTDEKKGDVAGQGRISAARIAELLDRCPKAVSKDLAALIRKGALERIYKGSAKAGKSNVYKVICEGVGIEINPAGVEIDTKGVDMDTKGVGIDGPSASRSASLSKSTTESEESIEGTPNDVNDEAAPSSTQACSQEFGLENGLGEAATQEYDSVGGLLPDSPSDPDHYCHSERVCSLDPYLWAALSPELKQAIESYMHITPDGVVVYPSSMDPDLKDELWVSGLTNMEAE